MSDLTIVLPGRPPTLKNNPIFLKDRNILLPNKQYREFKKFAIGTLKRPGYLLIHYGNIQFTDPVELTVDYFLADRRIPDVGNLVSATCDLLQDSGIVEDDRLIWNINAAISGIDRQNPRQEINLTINKPGWWK